MVLVRVVFSVLAILAIVMMGLFQLVFEILLGAE
jgi:hypothetical protein